MDIAPEEFYSKSRALCRNKEDAGILLAALHKITYNKDDVIIKQGEPGSTLYIVWDGSVSISLQCEKLAVKLGEIFPGSWVGELGFIEPGPASATVTSNEETTLLSLDEEGLKDLLDKHPDIVSHILQVLSLSLAKRLRETKQYTFKKIADDDFMLTKKSKPKDTEKWYRNLGHKLMGISGEKQ